MAGCAEPGARRGCPGHWSIPPGLKEDSLSALLVSTGIVALAEMGDKTQLLALLLAAMLRRPVPIILGILVATLANHALAIPHHAGAVEMARLELVHGRDPLARRLAEEIIASQTTEIEAMRARLSVLEKGQDADPGGFPAIHDTRGGQVK